MTLVFTTEAGSLCIFHNVLTIGTLKLNCQYAKCGREFESTSLLSKYCCESHRVMQFNLTRVEITPARNSPSLKPSPLSL